MNGQQQRGAADYRVLVVDDDFYVAKLHAKDVDATPGFTALEPELDSRRVLARVQSDRPDLVLLDVHLPHISGLELLPHLDADVMHLTASTEAETVREGLRKGALAYLVKPFDTQQLVSKLRSYARYRRILETGSHLDQAAIDRAQRVMFTGDESVASTPAPTEQSIMEAVPAPPSDVTVVEVAEAVGVSRATAQRYLSQLAREGRLKLELSYGHRGRPEHRYTRA
jgi:two-component system CitB family response regulator